MLHYSFISDVTDSFLAGFCMEARDSGRLARFFYDREPQSDRDFVRWCRNGDNLPWFVFLEGRPVAMCALNGKKGRTAWGHFLLLPCGTRRLAGMPLQKAVTVGMLAQWLHARNPGGEYALDRVLGLTPLDNPAAVKTAHRMGGLDVGEIPGACFVWQTMENVPGLVTEHNRQTVPASGLEI